MMGAAALSFFIVYYSYVSMASKHIHFPIQNEYKRTLCLRTRAGVAKVQLRTRYREERLRVGIAMAIIIDLSTTHTHADCVHRGRVERTGINLLAIASSASYCTLFCLINQCTLVDM